MRIKKYVQADAGVAAALEELKNECAAADGFAADISLDASMNAEKEMACVFTCEEGGRLVALLSIFAPGREEVEVNALVHHACRRRGYFKSLLKEAVAECSLFGYDRGLFVVDSASTAGKAVIARWGCGTDHVELQMERRVTPDMENGNNDIEVAEAKESDIEQLADLGAAAFSMSRESEREHIKNTLAADNRVQYAVRAQGRLVALCAASEYTDKMMIFGLGVHPGERRKGYAKALLGYISDTSRQRGIQKVCLDVDEENTGARALYESYGFVATGRTEYRTFYFEDFR